tara:strand:- start:2642 stop:3844 length:1203 start_codon:yes stop_codon:yes gene_type:complete
MAKKRGAKKGAKALPLLIIGVLAVGLFGLYQVTGFGSLAASVIGAGGTSGNTVETSVSVEAVDLEDTNVIAGTDRVRAGQFTFTGNGASYVLDELEVVIPSDVSTSITDVTLRYKNVFGFKVEKTQAVVASNSHATASFLDVGMRILKNKPRNIHVLVGLAGIHQGAKSGAILSAGISLDEGLRVLRLNGESVHSVGEGVLYGDGKSYIRKTLPKITGKKPSRDIAAGAPLYEFRVRADKAGPVEWKKISFEIETKGVEVGTLYAREVGSTSNINDIPVDIKNGIATIYVGKSDNNDVEQIAAGEVRRYQLYATSITGWSRNEDYLKIRIMGDSSYAENSGGPSIARFANIVWSDRSEISHNLQTKDWINGFLIEGIDKSTVKYGHRPEIPDETGGPEEG